MDPRKAICVTNKLQHVTLRQEYPILLEKQHHERILGKSNLDKLKIEYRITCDDGKDRWLSSKNFLEVGE